jgi:hypothetical protein
VRDLESSTRRRIAPGKIAMVTQQTLVELMTAEPFKPFRLHTTSGRTFEIRYPEMFMIGRSSVSIYARSECDEPQPRPWQDVLFTLLESIEPFEIAGTIGNR